jgi:hypothetical protein
VNIYRQSEPERNYFISILLYFLEIVCILEEETCKKGTYGITTKEISMTPTLPKCPVYFMLKL